MFMEGENCVGAKIKDIENHSFKQAGNEPKDGS